VYETRPPSHQSTITHQQFAIGNTLFAPRHPRSGYPRRLLRDLEPFLRQDIVRDAPSVNRQTAVVKNASKLRDLLWHRLEFDQLEHLSVAVLLDDVDALVRVYEGAELVGERIGTKTEVRGLEIGLLAELIAALLDGPVRCAIAENADLR